jgi:hypothetical protein
MGKISWGACPGKPVQPSVMKYTSFVGLFQVTKIMKCCEYSLWGHIDEPFILFVIYEWAK